MSENIYNIFSDLIEVPDIITCAWYSDEYSVYWNDDDNLLELYEGEGDTYSVEVYGKTVEREGYIFVNFRDCTGRDGQMILQKDKRVEFTDKLVESLYGTEEGEEL